jgi:sulfate permease, SulP family
MSIFTQRYGYGLSSLRSDVQAAATVAAISLPQSIAYALIAGVDPRFGLYTAIVFTAVAAIFGSSSQLVNGPTGAVSLVVFSALSFIDPDARLDSYEAMFLLAGMVGLVQIIVGVLKLGSLTRYISESVVTGFIVGAGTLTAVGQVGNALGLKNMGTGHQHVLYRLWLTLAQPAHANWKALAISGGAIMLAIISRKFVRRYKLPQLDMLAVLLLVSIPAYYAGWTHGASHAKTAVALIEAVPPSLPHLHIPDIRFRWVLELSTNAVAIAFLGLLEALAIAEAIAYKTRQKLDYDRQCLAEGIGNVTGAFFRCMPGSGSLSRSAINYQAGAATRLSGAFCAVFVTVMVLLLGPLTRYIPKAALAGLLIVAALRLIDVERLRYIARASRYDAVLLIATTLAALIIGVEFAILAGVAVSLLLFMPRAAKLKVSELVVSDERIVRERLRGDEECTAVRIYDFEGELFFGAARTFEERLEEARNRARDEGHQHVVFRFKRLRNPDAVCLEKLEHFLRDTQKSGLVILLAGVRPDLLSALSRLQFTEWFPENRVFAEEDQAFSATLKAVRQAYTFLGEENTCAHCSARAPVSGEGRAAYYLV